MCHLHDILDQQNDKISGGQKQRLMIAIALVNNPDLIFLDEPSTGLDPQARHNLWEIVKIIKAQGKTVVLTTHYMEEAEYLCDEIAILDRGEIIAYGSPDELIKTYCKSTSVLLPMKDIESRISDLPYTYQIVDGIVEIQVDDIKECFNTLMEKNIPFKNVRVHTPNLEDVFLTLTGRKLRE
jgi:ABC-2 type transport system ATP-binding protein